MVDTPLRVPPGAGYEETAAVTGGLAGRVVAPPCGAALGWSGHTASFYPAQAGFSFAPCRPRRGTDVSGSRPRASTGLSTARACTYRHVISSLPVGHEPPTGMS
jgi:hypothetical protein